MKFEDLIQIFRSWGHETKPEHYDGFKKYLCEALERNRLITVRFDDEVEVLLVFLLTDDYKTIYKKSMWELPIDNPSGRQIYIDKMICKNWTPSIRRSVQQFIEDAFPNVMEGYYHRAPFDRCVKIYRRSVPCTK